MSNRFIVQKNTNALSNFKYIIIDSVESNYVCGRFETKKDASNYSRRLNEKWA